MTPPPAEISFIEYLAAKRTVDDRALNRHVLGVLRERLPTEDRLRVVEVGAGIGTMIQRAWDWGLLPAQADYTAIDADTQSIEAARERLRQWATGQGVSSREAGGALLLEGAGRRLAVRLEAADAFEFAARAHAEPWGLLIAHAFLDLVDIPRALPPLLGLLAPGGLAYLTLNFDGLTLFEPALDPPLDAQIEALYHRTMDERVVAGRPSGDSRSGRRLIGHLRDAGAQVLAAGGSDWVVLPAPGGGYPADEAAFLHCVLHTVEAALCDLPELDAARFAAWLAERHAQVERGELVYIAHQLDVLARVPG